MEYLGCFELCDSILLQTGVDNGFYEITIKSGNVKYSATEEVINNDLVLNLGLQPFFLPEQGRYYIEVEIGGVLTFFYFDLEFSYNGINFED